MTHNGMNESYTHDVEIKKPVIKEEILLFCFISFQQSAEGHGRSLFPWQGAKWVPKLPQQEERTRSFYTCSVASCKVNSHSPTTRASLVRGGEDKSVILLGFLHLKRTIRSGEEQGHFEKEIV